MDIVNELTDAHLEYWQATFPDAQRITMCCPSDLEDCEDCGAVVNRRGFSQEVHVAWKPNEIELADLARGGTIWVTVVGVLPPHYLTVQAP